VLTSSVPQNGLDHFVLRCPELRETFSCRTRWISDRREDLPDLVAAVDGCVTACFGRRSALTVASEGMLAEQWKSRKVGVDSKGFAVAAGRPLVDQY
jgi:hypothetical protein